MKGLQKYKDKQNIVTYKLIPPKKYEKKNK